MVLRGKWILENLLNAPPPPAPPNVPNLEEAVVGEHATLRQRMEVHRANAVCASCHAKMDPLGFGLENFDAIGSWREKEGPTPIDATGVLPDGKTFNGPVELVEVLRSESSAFVQGLSERMLTYALGRGSNRLSRVNQEDRRRRRRRPTTGFRASCSRSSTACPSRCGRHTRDAYDHHEEDAVQAHRAAWNGRMSRAANARCHDPGVGRRGRRQETACARCSSTRRTAWS